MLTLSKTAEKLSKITPAESSDEKIILPDLGFEITTDGKSYYVFFPYENQRFKLNVGSFQSLKLFISKYIKNEIPIIRPDSSFVNSEKMVYVPWDRAQKNRISSQTHIGVRVFFFLLALIPLFTAFAEFCFFLDYYSYEAPTAEELLTDLSPLTALLFMFILGISLMIHAFKREPRRLVRMFGIAIGIIINGLGFMVAISAIVENRGDPDFWGMLITFIIIGLIGVALVVFSMLPEKTGGVMLYRLPQYPEIPVWDKLMDEYARIAEYSIIRIKRADKDATITDSKWGGNFYNSKEYNPPENMGVDYLIPLLQINLSDLPPNEYISYHGLLQLYLEENSDYKLSYHVEYIRDFEPSYEIDKSSDCYKAELIPDTSFEISNEVLKLVADELDIDIGDLDITELLYPYLKRTGHSYDDSSAMFLRNPDSDNGKNLDLFYITEYDSSCCDVHVNISEEALKSADFSRLAGDVFDDAY